MGYWGTEPSFLRQSYHFPTKSRLFIEVNLIAKARSLEKRELHGGHRESFFFSPPRRTPMRLCSSSVRSQEIIVLRSDVISTWNTCTTPAKGFLGRYFLGGSQPIPLVGALRTARFCRARQDPGAGAEPSAREPPRGSDELRAGRQL